MFDLEERLSYFFLSEKRTSIIRTHSWDIRKESYNLEYGLSNGEYVFCLKCNIEFEKVLYRQLDPDGTRWSELTCDEILIKKLLE